MSDVTDIVEPKDRGLPFVRKKQDAILGWVLKDTKFFLQCRNFIKSNWFDDKHAGKVFTALLNWHEANGRVPTIQELKYCSELVSEDPKTAPKLQAKIDESIKETEFFSLEPLAQELTMWMRARIFYTGVHAAQTDYNNSRFEQAYTEMDKTLKSIKEASFLREKESSLSNWRKDFEDAQNEQARGLTFGLQTVDDLLLPANQGGSLLPGDTTILLAPTNVGKTTTLITTSGANLKLGKRILLITHEGRPMDIKEKIWKNYLDVDTKGLFALSETDEGVEQLERASAVFNRNLTFIPYNKAGLTVEEVESLIRRKQEEAMGKRGRGYDMLIVDYPAKLTTRQAQGGSLNKRTIDEIVYGYFIQLALEYNFHSLLAIQTNREGAKVNKGQRDERRLLVMEDVHESYGVMQEATNVITLNRDAIAKARNRLTFHIDKSRSSETGFAVVANSSFGHATTHSNKLGSIWYRGVSTMADQVDDLLANPDNYGKEIDVTQFL